MNVLQIKAAVRERDGHRRTRCGMTEEAHRERFGRALEVHRQEPGSDYAVDSSCVTVCKPCHGTLPRRPRGTVGFVRLKKPFVRILARLAEQRFSTITGLANQAVREYLEREGLWPPRT